MKEGDEMDAGRIEKARIHGFQAERVVGSEMIVFNLNHRLSRLIVQLRDSLSICEGGWR